MKEYIKISKKPEIETYFTEIIKTLYDSGLPFLAGALYATTHNALFLFFLITPAIANWDIISRKIIRIK